MHKLIDTSSSSIATGVGPQRKLLKIDTGPYADRLIAIYNESSNNIAMTWADPPYNNWSDPVILNTGSADYPLSTCIDPSGDIYVIYVQQTTLNLVFFKLAFSAGVWATGSPIVIMNQESAFYPVIARHNDGDLWCAYAYYDSTAGDYRIRVKGSADDGQTWGNGITDPGTELSGSSSEMPYAGLNFIGNDLYAVYSENRTDLYFRKLPSGGNQWNAAVLIYSGNYIDSEFDSDVSREMKLGVAFAVSGSARVYFREYDGVSLGGLMEVAQVEARAIQMIYKTNKPYVFYAENIGNDYFYPKCAHLEGSSFNSTDLIRGIGLLDRVYLYHAGSDTFENKTSEAVSEAAADIYHSQSGAMISEVGDCLYLGKDEKFFCLSVVLSTPGTGGTVAYEYYDGTDWVIFSPYSGSLLFTDTSSHINLWKDIESIPAGWQACSVNSVSKYWIRCYVHHAFTVAPVGTQLLASPRADYINQARGAL